MPTIQFSDTLKIDGRDYQVEVLKWEAHLTSDEGVTHTVTRRQVEGAQCNCKAFTYRSNDEATCKHIRALMTHSLLHKLSVIAADEERGGDPIDFTGAAKETMERMGRPIPQAPTNIWEATKPDPMGDLRANMKRQNAVEVQSEPDSKKSVEAVDMATNVQNLGVSMSDLDPESIADPDLASAWHSMQLEHEKFIEALGRAYYRKVRSSRKTK